MDNAQKAIMVGVGLFITIIIISAVMLISSAGQDLIDESMDELSNLSDSLSRQLYADFAGSTLSGTEVIGAVKKYVGQKNAAGTNITVTVIDKVSGKKLSNNTDTIVYTTSTVGAVSSDVDSTGKYESKVVEANDGEYITGITFTRIKGK